MMRKINLTILGIISSLYMFCFVALVFLLSLMSDSVRVDTLLFRDVQAGFLMIIGLIFALLVLVLGIVFRIADKKIAPFLLALALLILLMGIGLLPAALITGWMGMIHFQAKEGGTE